jgi:hypothetical protein
MWYVDAVHKVIHDTVEYARSNVIGSRASFVIASVFLAYIEIYVFWGNPLQADSLGQGSSTFQIVRATLTISMMPAGHKAIHDVHVHISGTSGRSVNLTTNRYIMCRQRAGLGFVVIFSKRLAGHGKGLRGPHVARGPRVEDPWPRAKLPSNTSI